MLAGLLSKMTSKTDPEHNLSSLEAVPSAPGEVLNSSEEESDAVFGAANAGGPKYRSVRFRPRRMATKLSDSDSRSAGKEPSF